MAARVLVLGAHPDDAEVFAGGLVVRHCLAGSSVKIISVTDGSSGHHEIPPQKLRQIRSAEAANAGSRVGAEYITWDFRDGYLEPNLKVREAIIRAIREFEPDLVLTHRPNDYHPDHRAVGIAVQDASYLVTVPHVCDDVAALKSDPVVAYMCDLFTRPNRMRPDVVLDVSAEFDRVISMAACHESQFFGWLAYHDGKLDQVPDSATERHQWLAEEFANLHRSRAEFFREELSAANISADAKVEIFEVSEYATALTDERLDELFPKQSS